MLLFDALTRETCIVRRARTSTPLQALALLNDTQFVEAARAFAPRIMLEGGQREEGRIIFGFRLATARKPRLEESKVLQKILHQELNKFRIDGGAAQSYLKVGTFRQRRSLGSVELAAWSVAASVILNLDETMTKN